jgi:hypothetical protein
MREVQDPREKMDTARLRAAARSFLEEMNGSEDFLNKMKPVEGEELAASLIESSKDMARYLSSALDIIDRQNVALDLALAKIKNLEGTAPSKPMQTVRPSP